MSSFSLLSNVLVSLVLLWRQNDGCVDITGIGDEATDYYTYDSLEAFRTRRGPPVARPASDEYLEGVRETPITFRARAYEFISVFSVFSYYDSVALEFFGRSDIMSERRFCRENYGIDDDFTNLFNLHALVANNYISLFLYKHVIPETEFENEANDAFNVYLNAAICEDENVDCTDTSTPWGLAYTVANEIFEFMDNDGWNHDGSLNRDYNKIPFSDFRSSDTKYVPKNDPWSINDIDKWQPLLESDELGFLYNQEHVTPHIGYTGKSFIYTNDEFCDRSEIFQSNSENLPNYGDYESEMDLVIERSRDLTEIQKMLIESFDDKGVLGNVELSMRRFGSDPTNGEGFGRLVSAANALLNNLALYEGVIAVWKEKIDFDRIRPPSIIHEKRGDELLTSYAGSSPDGESYGTQTFYARDWEPYIRTMPHSEYPSASACVCEAYAQAFRTFHGFDSFENVLSNGVYTANFNAFTSIVEPLSTPSSDISYQFSSFSDVSDICGESRLWGGMHFTQSVTSGRKLCYDIGTDVANLVLNLLKGTEPEYIIDINDHTIVERNCYGQFDESSSSSSED